MEKEITHTASGYRKTPVIQKFYFRDDGTFPNSNLPVLYYPSVLKVPFFFAAAHVKKLFALNDWTNSWKAGVFTFHHYHSTAHEVMAVIRGETRLQLGGERNGMVVQVKKGDVLILPAGTAHKNLGNENDVVCIGAYPQGRDYDMNYGKPGERPGTDANIKALPRPARDPLFGKGNGVPHFWTAKTNHYVFERRKSPSNKRPKPKNKSAADRSDDVNE
jgi:uncharacterized protein YjlB